MTTRQLKLFSLIAGLEALLIDQLIKTILLRKIPASGIFLIQNEKLACSLQTAFNKFIAFSLPLNPVLIYILTSVLLIGLVYFVNKAIEQKDVLTAISIATICGAALSNLLDRVIHGAVVDYLALTIYNYHWATFNLADSLITIFAIILIIKNLKK